MKFEEGEEQLSFLKLTKVYQSEYSPKELILIVAVKSKFFILKTEINGCYFPKKRLSKKLKRPRVWILSGEFLRDPNKEVHIHVINEEGSMKIRLSPVERDESQDTDVPPSNQREIIKFVKEHLEFIKQRARGELEKRNIKITKPF